MLTATTRVNNIDIDVEAGYSTVYNILYIKVTSDVNFLFY